MDIPNRVRFFYVMKAKFHGYNQEKKDVEA
jgi:hypothetical protein